VVWQQHWPRFLGPNNLSLLQPLLPSTPMGVIRGLLSGFALAGVVTFAYEQQIYNTSSYLRTALNSLSKDLDTLRIRRDPEEIPQEPVALERLPVSEQIKVQVGGACGRPKRGKTS